MALEKRDLHFFFIHGCSRPWELSVKAVLFSLSERRILVSGKLIAAFSSAEK